LKYFILFLLFIFQIRGAHGQSTWEARAGINDASFGSKNADQGLQTTSKISFYIGACVNLPVGRHFSITPGIEYAMQGGTVTDNSNFFVGNGNFSLQYIAVPIQLRYDLSSKIFFQTGPRASILISAAVSENGSTFHGTNGFSAIDYSWEMGAGLLLSKEIGIDFHYNLGINSIYEANNISDLKNRVFQAGLFYLFK